MKPEWAPTGLLSQVLWRVAPSIMVVLLSIWLGVTLLSRHLLIEETTRHLREVASHEAEEITFRLRSARDLLQGLAANDLLVNAVFQGREEGGYLETFFRSLRLGPVAGRLTLADYRGRPLASSGRPGDYEGRPWLDRVMEREGFHWELSAHGLLMATSVRYHGLAEGLLVLEYTSEEVESVIGIHDDSDTSIHYFVLNDVREVLFASDHPHPQNVEHLQTAEWLWTVEEVPGFDGVALLVATPRAQAFSALTFLQNGLLLAVIADLLALTAGIVVTARLVSDPLRSFVQALGAIGRTHDLTHRCREAGPLEIRQLAVGFNDLLARLDDSDRSVKEQRVKLMQSEKMASLGQLAAGVAHEINNPMSYIMSNLHTLARYVGVFRGQLQRYQELAALEAPLQASGNGRGAALRGEIDAQRQAEDVDYALSDVDQLLAETEEGALRIKEIVQGLRQFARLDDDSWHEADLDECLEGTLKMVWNELKYRCEVRKELKPLPLVHCRPGQMNQVFMNLLINASHAIPEHGIITLASAVEEGFVVIKISDTGNGIAEEHLPHIFNPFFTTKPVGQGTGLGLAIVHGIIEEHQGAIEVASRVGEGTTFTIRLPVSTAVREG